MNLIFHAYFRDFRDISELNMQFHVHSAHFR